MMDTLRILSPHRFVTKSYHVCGLSIAFSKIQRMATCYSKYVFCIPLNSMHSIRHFIHMHPGVPQI